MGTAFALSEMVLVVTVRSQHFEGKVLHSSKEFCQAGTGSTGLGTGCDIVYYDSHL